MKEHYDETENRHLEMLRKELAGCTVLLKTNGDFPLAEAGRLALYGNGARHTIKGGTGSGEVNSRFFINAEQGLKDAGFEIVTGQWLDSYDRVLEEAGKRFLDNIRAQARAHRKLAIIESMGAVMPEPDYDIPLGSAGEAEATVYVLARTSGEGSDRTYDAGDIRLTDSEVRDILALCRDSRRFMLVLNVGGPVDLSPVTEVPNILLLSQLGTETGTALARIILGQDVPSGRLTTSWARPEDRSPYGDFGDPDDTYYREGIYVGYRYYDTAGIRPVFPFGYGLSYTEFERRVTGADADGETIRVEAVVKNTGSRFGREVLQLYVSAPSVKLDRPVQSLAAFAKTGDLKPGEEEKLTLSFRMSDLSGYDTLRAAYILEAGDYILRLGVSSEDTECIGIVRLSEEIVTKKTRNMFKESPEDIVPRISASGRKYSGEVYENVPILDLRSDAISSVTTDYDRACPTDPITEAMTDEELAYMNVGAFNETGGIASVIGDASFSVAGAAGETTARLKDRGIPTIVMADGPAGLRLSKDAVKTKKGVTTLGPVMPESMAKLLPGPVRLLLKLLEKKPSKRDSVFHQYATAIPIGTAIAQSWDLSLAGTCGDIVGAEMQQFGVNLWLAPALNIHRDIRCGRNFEYYSEDPLISGKMAAAVTAGVQKHPGCGCVIKHFAANNQETNRYSNNSHVSERALREIYLKGFEICIREAHPAAVMTSYNLLNGTHTSELRELTEDCLRCEFGFDGVVMTDWVVSQMYDRRAKYPAPRADLTAAAGGDIFMPGSVKDHRAILQALQAGTLSRRQVQENAARLIRLIMKLNADLQIRR